MPEAETKKSLLDELKMERKHQEEFIRRLERFYDELNRNGYRPLDRVRQMIVTWEQNLSLVEKQIKALEETSTEAK